MKPRTRAPSRRATRLCARAALAVIAVVPAHPLWAQGVPAGPSPARVISLDDAIRIALDQNSSVRLSRNASTLDSLSVRQFRNQFLPSLSASSQSSQGFLNAPGVRSSFSSSLGLSSGLTLYNGRQNVNTLREAEITAHASEFELARTKQTIVFTVATDFLNLITQQALLRVQLEDLAAQQEQLTQIRAFVDAGTHPIGDLYQQQSALAAAQLGAANANRATELAKVDLIQELVLDPRLSYEFAPPPSDSSQPPEFNLDSLINVALRQRTDIQALTFRVEAAEREISIAEGGRLPVISASVGYGTALNTEAAASVDNQLKQRLSGSIGVGISFPIFDRGAVSIARQRAQVALDNEKLSLRDQTQAAALDVRRAYLNYETALQQITSSDAQVRAAALALEATTVRYRNGLATFVEVSLARATLVQAQSTLVNARASLTFQQALMSYYTGVLDASNLRIGR